jgi:AcrR family transcriptional regulator
LTSFTALPAESLAADEGLRARKKRRTRTEISDVATRLFAERGFEEVTLADIAAAADVSVKTIFNHFGSKEELYFDRAEEMERVFEATIVGRDPGVTVLFALRRLLVDNVMPFPNRAWARLAKPEAYDRLRAYLAVEDGAPVLQARRLVIAGQLGATLEAVLAAELQRPEGDASLRALAGFIVAALHVRDQVVRTAMRERRPPRRVRSEVCSAVNATFDRLDLAFADLDREKPT